MKSTLLLLADGRFPAGGHAHSGGLEKAVAAGRVRDGEDLYAFLAGRLSSAGRVDASLAAVAWSCASSHDELAALDAEASARCPSPALREASRAQWGGLARAAREIWATDSDADELVSLAWLSKQLRSGPMYPTALGPVGKLAMLSISDVALVAAQSAVSGPAWAATRLMGLGPYTVGRCLARLAPQVEGEAAAAAAAAQEASAQSLGERLARLPAYGAPLLEIGAEDHARWEVRLFAS
jgi:urease accessory protein